MKLLPIKNSSTLSQAKSSEIEIILSYLEVDLNFDDIKKFLHLESNSLQFYVSSLYLDYPQEFDQLKKYLSFQHLLKLRLETHQFNHVIKSLLFKSISYPILLYILMYLLMAFFILVLIPSLLTIIELMDVKPLMISILHLFLRIIFVLLSVINLFILLFLFLLRKRSNMKLFFILLSKNRWFQTIKEIITFQFVQYYSLFLDKGFSTQLALVLMREGSFSYLVSWLSTLLTYELEDGSPLAIAVNEEYFDSKFIQLLKLGNVSNQTQHLLHKYLENSFKLIEIKLKLLGSRLKLFTYILLALLILIMYQILLAPMSLMQNF